MGIRYIVTGAEGQLGRCLVRGLCASDSGATLVAAHSHRELDIGDEAAVQAWGEGLCRLDGGPPEVCVNAAAYNAVDACEGEGAEQARRVNSDGPGFLASACERIGARLVHVSTDYVFAGDADRPVAEDAPAHPKTAYGRSKLAGEERVREASPDSLVVRTSWVFGPGRNFVGAILRQAELRRRGEAAGPLRVVDDQVGRPTYAADLAEGLCALVRATRRGARQGGLYHLCNGSRGSDPSWWDFARAILDRGGYGDLEIARTRTADLDLPAVRPAYSVLDCGRAGALGVRLRPWEDALAAYFGSPDLEATLDLMDVPVRGESKRDAR